MLPTLALLGAVLAGPPSSHASRPDSNPYAVSAQRVTAASGAPRIDGHLSDAIWTATDSVSDFVQMEPNPGAPSRFRTVARVAFDDEAVYVAVRAYDPEPEKIMAQLTRRDARSPSDWVMIGFDSRFDRRTAYVFGVNPVGVKRDLIISNDVDEDEGWDAVWEVQARRDSLGWAAEFRIPLSALRFSTGGDGVWGFQVVREVQREREESAWAPMRADEARIVSRFGELHGMRDLQPPRRLEVLPYTVSRLTRAPGEQANPFYSASQLGASAGVDLKYGLTSNLTLDLTVNPDFGQVEADPSQVNLSAYETFFPEQRPFFTEGADIFRFGIALGDGDGANEQLFYSRRIGRAPQASPRTASGEYADVPTQSRIVGAAKLSGRTNGGWSLGVLNAVTAEEHARIAAPGGAERSAVVEPLTNYSVLRLRRDLNGGRTQIGAVGTGVVRRLDGEELDWLRSAAAAGGVDFSHRFAGDRWMVQGSLLGSRIQGSETAILRAQTSAARYFQRPDAGHLALDSTATSLSGWFATYSAMKIAGGKWRGGVLGQARSPGFEVNDLGYQRNADQVINVAWLGYQDIEPGRVFRTVNLNTNLWKATNFGGEDLALGFNVNGFAQLLNNWRGNGGIGLQQSALDPTALRGGPAIRTPAALNGWMGVNSDFRKPFSVGLNANGRVEEESGTRFVSVGLDGRWRVSSRTQLSLSPRYSANRDAWQYVTQRDDAAGARHYLFGDLSQQTLSVRTRVNHTFTPELSFQLYAQPFISAGTFRSFSEVRDPRAARFDSRLRTFAPHQVARSGDDLVVRTGEDASSEVRFSDPDFNVRALNLNAVLRWEYRPGSTLFVVWSHGRNSYARDGHFRLHDDLDALLDARPTNVFLVKANWWMNL